METLVISIKNEKDAKFIKELLSRLDVEIKVNKSSVKKILGKSKIKSVADLRAMGGIAKGQLVSKEHLRNLSWKKRV